MLFILFIVIALHSLERGNSTLRECWHGVFVHMDSNVDSPLEFKRKPCEICILLISMGNHTEVYMMGNFSYVNLKSMSWKKKRVTCPFLMQKTHLVATCRLTLFNMGNPHLNRWQKQNHKNHNEFLQQKNVLCEHTLSYLKSLFFLKGFSHPNCLKTYHWPPIMTPPLSHKMGHHLSLPPEVYLKKTESYCKV